MSGKLDDFLSDIEVEANTRGREAVQGRDGWCVRHHNAQRSLLLLGSYQPKPAL